MNDRQIDLTIIELDRGKTTVEESGARLSDDEKARGTFRPGARSRALDRQPRGTAPRARGRLRHRSAVRLFRCRPQWQAATGRSPRNPPPHQPVPLRRAGRRRADARRLLGVDVVATRRADRDAVVARFSLQRSRRPTGRCRRPRGHAFYDGWTRKEVVIKATGDSSADLGAFDVSPCRMSRHACCPWAAASRRARRWQLFAPAARGLYRRGCHRGRGSGVPACPRSAFPSPETMG